MNIRLTQTRNADGASVLTRTYTMQLTERELHLIVRALETEKSELRRVIPEGMMQRAWINEIVELRNKVRDAK